MLTDKVVDIIWFLSKLRCKPIVVKMAENELIPSWYSSVRERRRKAEDEKRGMT